MGQRKGIAFDLDGVLVDTASFHFKAWKKILMEHFGVEHTQEVDEKTKGIGRVECMRLILREYKISLPEEQVYEIAQEKNRYYVHLLRTELDESCVLPGIAGVLRDLRETHVPAVLASSSYNAPLIVEKLGLPFGPGQIVNPADVACGKPAPDIYRLAAGMLGLAPQECVGVEDAASGVEAVKAAGMYCIGIGQRELLGRSDMVIPSTRELKAALRRVLW